MQGTVTAVVAAEQRFYIQADDGRMLSCSAELLDSSTPFASVYEGLRVVFEASSDGKVSAVKAAGKDAAAGQGTAQAEFEVRDRFEVPEQITLEQGTERKGCVLVDTGEARISASARSLEEARSQVMALCRELGGNTLLEVRIYKQKRPGFGYNVVIYEATGKPALAAVRDEHGSHTYGQLRGSLNHERIRSIGNKRENLAAARIVMKWLSVLLIIIFCAGFIYATFLA